VVRLALCRFVLSVRWRLYRRLPVLRGRLLSCRFRGARGIYPRRETGGTLRRLDATGTSQDRGRQSQGRVGEMPSVAVCSANTTPAPESRAVSCNDVAVHSAGTVKLR